MNLWEDSRLKGRTKEVGLRQEDVGTAIGRTATIYSLKLNGKAEFGQSEIDGICKFLRIPYAGLPSYFFAEGV